MSAAPTPVEVGDARVGSGQAWVQESAIQRRLVRKRLRRATTWVIPDAVYCCWRLC